MQKAFVSEPSERQIHGRALNYVPPCICCRTSDDEGPQFNRRWKSALNSEFDGCFDLFQPDSSQPCAWVHRSCLFEFVLHHGTKTPAGKFEIDKVCMICEVKVHTADLLALCKQNDVQPLVWTHRDCIASYYR